MFQSKRCFTLLQGFNSICIYSNYISEQFSTKQYDSSAEAEDKWEDPQMWRSASMFSDPLDGTSSNDMSCDEVDMYGSDPDVETISLGAGSNDNVQCLDEEVVCVQSAQPIYSTLYIWQDGDSVLGMADITLAISELDILVRALCDADRIDITLLESDAEDESDSAPFPQNTCNTCNISIVF